MLQRFMDPERFVFLDETGATTKMTSLLTVGDPDLRLDAAEEGGGRDRAGDAPTCRP